MFNVINAIIAKWQSNPILFLFPNVYILAHFGEQGSMILAIKLRRYHVLILSQRYTGN